MTYANGIALGSPQIHSDSIFFRYNDETWEFSTFAILSGDKHLAHFNGIHYEAKVKDLRRLANKKHG